MNNVSKNKIIDTVHSLILMHKKGLLGGEVMPEDENPGLVSSSRENYLYFTLPMALNYQRNSYKLWESANASYIDPETACIFHPEKVVAMSDEELRSLLIKHKVALQPNKHIEIWKRLSNTIVELFEGDVRNLFIEQGSSVYKTLEYVQKEQKKRFPYLSGKKICTYWLYVLEQYTDIKFNDRQHLSIAPDTHVIQASVRLGVIPESVIESSNIREEVSHAWEELLSDSELLPIDVHTPLWLWSRGNFIDVTR